MKNENSEIERKFLVKMVNIENLVTFGLKIVQIEQIYLEKNNLIEKRIRKKTEKNGTKYYYTEKIDKTGGVGIERDEDEKEITEKKYEELLSKLKKPYLQVNKTRHIFTYMNQVFELDVYPFDKEKAILEIELESKEQSVIIPTFIEVIKEVTCDSRYRNYSLAENHELAD